MANYPDICKVGPINGQILRDFRPTPALGGYPVYVRRGQGKTPGAYYTESEGKWGGVVESTPGIRTLGTGSSDKIPTLY